MHFSHVHFWGAQQNILKVILKLGRNVFTQLRKISYTAYTSISGGKVLLYHTQWCKIITAKFRELILNFPKLADWLCMGWPSCLAALRGEI